MTKKNILILGAGKIGTAIATLLGSAKEYALTVADVRAANIPGARCVTLDVSDQNNVREFLTQSPQQAVISCLPYHQNTFVLALAKQYGLHYFDLTEDVEVAEKAAEVAQGATQAFVTQCGLAPGFINIVGHSLIQKFDTVQTAKLRVGALPATSSHALHYALTWSVEGLINQYTRPCLAIENGQRVTLQPLEGLEQVELEGQLFEAFNTSGGLGTLAEVYAGKIDTLNYKTLRYLGHCEKMRFLLQDLKLSDRRDLCKAILEHALPQTEDDRVWVYVSVIGEKQGKLVEESYVKKFSPQTLGGKHWTAIQLSTASGLCAVFDIVMSHPEKYQGRVLHTQFLLEEILANRFGEILHMKFLKTLDLHSKNLGGYAAGKWLGNSPQMLDSVDPSNEKVIASVQLCSAQDYETIITEAQAAFLRWREVPAPKRGLVIRDIADALREKKDALGTLVAVEMGKSKQEGDGEVQEMIDIADFAVGQSRMLYGVTMTSERPQHRLYEQWHPLGMVGVITAFNFPVAVWAWNAFVAAVCGNVVVWKPSSKVPLCAIAVQHICNVVMAKHNCEGVFSFFVPNNVEISEKLLADKRVPLISFTGSTPVGRHVAEVVAHRLGKSILELGGNNAIIVDEFANLTLAIPAIVFAAVGTAGQRCTTVRRVIVHESRYEELKKKLLHAYAQITVGDPLEKQMGPLIDPAAVEAFENAVAAAKKQGGKVLFGGHALSGAGYFVAPTLVEAKNDWDIVQHETFAPLLYLMIFKTLPEAIAMMNNVSQGLSSGIFTDRLQHAEYYLSALGSDCGIANVNVGTSGAEIGGAFGGEKDTGGGREAGSDAWKAYMRRQTNTINWGESLPLAQGIQFE